MNQVLQVKRYLDELVLAQALWWFIENIPPDADMRGELFFYLRERVRSGK